MDRATHQLRARVALAIGCLACWLILLVNLVSLPAVDEPQPADVVYVLGPPRAERVATGVALVEGGYADTLVVTVNVEGRYAADRIPVCIQETAFEVICAKPEPFTTQGEARFLAELAAQNTWESAIIVTTTPHISRARVYFERCVGALDVMVVEDQRPIPVWRWVRQYVYETGAWAKAALTWGC